MSVILRAAAQRQLLVACTRTFGAAAHEHAEQRKDHHSEHTHGTKHHKSHGHHEKVVWAQEVKFGETPADGPFARKMYVYIAALTSGFMIYRLIWWPLPHEFAVKEKYQRRPMWLPRGEARIESHSHPHTKAEFEKDHKEDH